MKKLLFFLTISLCLNNIALAQWVQLGSDIDGEAQRNNFGDAVSISDDGSLIAIGGPGNSDSGLFSGHVRVYEEVNGNWIQLGSDIDGGMAGDWSGTAVSLSGDGNRVAIGAKDNANSFGAKAGHVRIFENNNGVWTQIGNDIEAMAFSEEFGTSVSTNSDGSIVAIGAPRNDEFGGDKGQVRIYQDSSGVWVQLGQSISEPTSALFGQSVSSSADGLKVAIGAPSGTGIVFIYHFLNGMWTQFGGQILGENSADNAGRAVAISDSGSVVAIGAFGNDGNGSLAGHVRVYRDSSGVWVQVGADIDGEAAGDRSGMSVSLSGDGSIVAIGAPENDGNGGGAGHVRVYQNVNGVWTQVGTDIDGESVGNESGTSVSISSDGSRVLVGAPDNSDAANLAGHARVYMFGAVGQSELSTPQISVHPNPSTGQIAIYMDGTGKVMILNIYNTLGALIHSEKLIKTSSFEYILPEPKGMYFLHFVDGQGANRSIRVLKE